MEELTSDEWESLSWPDQDNSDESDVAEQEDKDHAEILPAPKNGTAIDSPSASSEIKAEEESALWRAWLECRDHAARERLILNYMGFAKALAARTYARRIGNEFEFAEYGQFALVGLMEAIDRYRPANGAKFTTFAAFRIKGAILSGIDCLSERQRQIALRRRLAAERTASLKPKSLPVQHDQRLLRELGEVGIGLALALILEGSGMIQDPNESLPDQAYSRVYLRQLRRMIWQYVDCLTPREREVIHLHYLQQKCFEEISELLQLTKGRISQLHQQAIKRLQGALTDGNCDIEY